jgi:hypothetical protein
MFMCINKVLVIAKKICVVFVAVLNCDSVLQVTDIHDAIWKMKPDVSMLTFCFYFSFTFEQKMHCLFEPHFHATCNLYMLVSWGMERHFPEWGIPGFQIKCFLFLAPIKYWECMQKQGNTFHGMVFLYWSFACYLMIVYQQAELMKYWICEGGYHACQLSRCHAFHVSDFWLCSWWLGLCNGAAKWVFTDHQTLTLSHIASALRQIPDYHLLGYDAV